MRTYVRYVATGLDAQGRRFRIASHIWLHIQAINIYRGTRWGILPSGKRVVLERVYN